MFDGETFGQRRTVGDVSACGGLLPAPKPRRLRNPGRKRLDNRKALTGILFVLKSGPLEADCPKRWAAVLG